MALSASDVQHLREALQLAVIKCSERCLYQAAKWAAEILDALPEPEDGASADSQPSSSPAFMMAANQDPEEAALEAQELNKYLLAKAYFDCKEFDRCAAVFLPESALASFLGSHDDEILGWKGKEKSAARLSLEDGLPNISQRSLFLALYAKVMSGEKTKDEESEMIMGPQDVGSITNRQFHAVSRVLEMWFQSHRREDGEAVGSQGFLEYLYGMVLAKEKNDRAAQEYLLASIHTFPWNWGCWLEMADLVSREEELNRVAPQLPQNIMSFIFHIYTAVNLHQQGSHLSASLTDLLGIFPNSCFLLTCKALMAYHSRDMLAAEREFSHLLSMHPHRLDSLDHYSNILYVLNQRPKLAFLAHLCSNVDKFRPESCVVIGNYYSLLSQHEKAVQYFRRALTLDRSCLSAWTLMGHEYVELKNTHAAIESYRRAVDINRRDYRAWYGLGQTYEVLEMHAYALWYYKVAAGLRPWEGKMWHAVGSCLQKMGRDRDGIKAMKRALLADTYYDTSASSFGSASSLDRVTHMDPDILLQIAIMYDRLEEEDEAKAYMELCVAQEVGLGRRSYSNHDNGMAPEDTSDYDESTERDQEGGQEGVGVTLATSKARMWLARHALKNEDYATAEKLASELCYDGVEMEEAKALQREARSKLELEDVADR